MTPDVSAFIEWWEGLAPDQRREQIARARERQTYWRARRSRVLFGLLEDDSIFGTLDRATYQVAIDTDP